MGYNVVWNDETVSYLLVTIGLTVFITLTIFLSIHCTQYDCYPYGWVEPKRYHMDLFDTELDLDINA